MKFRTPFSPSDDFPGLVCPEPTLAQQHGAEETDINVLMERFKVTQTLPTSPLRAGFGDFTGVSDYRTAVHALMQARDDFNALPANIRARFNNDPGAFVEFATNPANLDELRALNLAKPAVGGIGGAAPDAKPSES